MLKNKRLPSLESHCTKYLGISFEEWAEQQAAVKAKKFNLPFGEISASEEADRIVEDELDAIDYFRASRGE